LERKYSYLVISLWKHYFVKYHSDSTHRYSKVESKKMLEFLTDNIFVVVSGQLFQQSVGIPMGTNCAPLSVDLFLYSYKAEFIQKLLHENKNLLAVAFNLTFQYINILLTTINSTHISKCFSCYFLWFLLKLNFTVLNSK
jgi:hypothetical protein